jgi:hypothetical protein
MMGSGAAATKSVTLNLFQGPSCLTALLVHDEKWMLKQVQHDDDRGAGA